MSDMHCPICKAVNNVNGGVQIRCYKCRNWSHHDNWTYTKEAWKRIQDAIKKRYGGR